MITNLGEAPVHLGAHRFASADLPAPLGSLAAGETADTRIPRDSAARPWRLVAEADAALEVRPRQAR